ncbi:MAG: Ig-like domain-containing protein [Methanobacterium sp.]|nr:Ig-like domain-containing protein [Methanobacterium sp.]
MGPQCIITFDDGYKSTYSIAYQYMQSKGIVGTVYINGDYSIGNPGTLSQSNLFEMNLAGWCIANHSYEHVDLSSLTDQQIYNVLLANINFLNSLGLNGGYHVAFPGGLYNQNVLEVMNELGIKTGRCIDPVLINNQYLNELNLYMLPSYPLSADVTVSEVESWINEAINTNSTIILTVHDIVDSNATDWTYLTSDFKLIIDYIANCGIRTITIDDFYEEVINAKANSPKPVTLYRNGSSVGSYNIIAEAVIAAQPGDTITLDNGSTFYENGISITKNLNFNVSDNGTATINGTNRAILNDGVNSIFGIYPGINVNLQNLIIENGSSAIVNMGNLKVTNCTFQNNNTIYGGGAIYNTGTLTAISCTFIGNAASYGGAVCNLGNTNLNFCRIFGNIGTDIYNAGGSIYALYNWWGQNSGPGAEQIYGTSNYSPWIYMALTSNPNMILTGNTSQIIADFNNIYDGTTVTPFNPNLGHLPDGIPVSFTGDILRTFSTQTMVTHNGEVITSFTAGPMGGVSHLTAAVDAATVTTDITIIAPLTVTSTNPTNKATGVGISSPITITFNENISTGDNFQGIYVRNLRTGSKMTITSKVISGKTLTLYLKSIRSFNTTYLVYLPAGAVEDNTGNGLASAYTFSFKTKPDATLPKVTSTNPTKYAIGVPLNTSPVTITFSENILAGANYSGIYIKNLTTGNKVSLASKTIINNTLTIKQTNIRLVNCQYQVYIPAGAVKDAAGNNLAATYTFKYST